MPVIHHLRHLIAALALLALAAPSASAQNDRVFPLNGNPISGPIESMTKNDVTIRTGGASQKIPGNTIVKIMFAGDPPELTRGREFALDNQFDKAVEELKKADLTKIRRDVITADLIFYRLLSEAKLSLIGQGDRAAAARNLLNFVQKHGDNWHFFDAARLLGDLAVAEGSYEGATKYYSALGSAAAPELKIEAAYLAGLMDLRQAKPAEALSSFDKVIGARVNSPEAARLQRLSKAGRVAALGLQGQTAPAIKESEALIAELDATDTELAARLYNARGAAFAKADQNEAAVRAYLHTHLMFSGTADAHVESLKALVQLWPQVGKPDRANQMRQVLQQTYPGWGG